MLRTFFFIIAFFGSLLLSLILLIPYPFFRIFRMDRARRTYTRTAAHTWAKLMLKASGANLTIEGLENLPKEGSALFVGNHQSNIDILVILGVIPFSIGFIAKQELNLVPIMNLWMRIIKCVLINRKNMRDSSASIRKGVEHLKNGYSMVVFPEGHRSKGAPMKKFKSGSFKLSIESGVPIIPVVLCGTYHMLEETGRIKKADVKLSILPAVQPGIYQNDSQKLAEDVEKMIRDKLAVLESHV